MISDLFFLKIQELKVLTAKRRKITSGGPEARFEETSEESIGNKLLQKVAWQKGKPVLFIFLMGRNFGCVSKKVKVLVKMGRG